VVNIRPSRALSTSPWIRTSECSAVLYVMQLTEFSISIRMDDRTRADRVEVLQSQWEMQMDRLVGAFLAYQKHGYDLASSPEPVEERTSFPPFSIEILDTSGNFCSFLLFSGSPTIFQSYNFSSFAQLLGKSTQMKPCSATGF
jgi:hypothetical protein